MRSNHLLRLAILAPLVLGVAVRLGAESCPALPPPTGSVVTVSSVPGLVAAVNGAAAGQTILVAPGYYELDGAYLRITAPGVTLRGQGGDREAVVLDGNYLTTEIAQVVASNVTVADLTLREAYDPPIHVMPSESAATNGTLVYNVHVIDPGQQAIKVNPLVPGGPYADGGTVLDSGTVARVWADAPCPGAGGTYVDHFGGIARNNAVSAHTGGLFASEYGSPGLEPGLLDGPVACRQSVSA